MEGLDLTYACVPSILVYFVFHTIPNIAVLLPHMSGRTITLEQKPYPKPQSHNPHLPSNKPTIAIRSTKTDKSHECTRKFSNERACVSCSQALVSLSRQFAWVLSCYCSRGGSTSTDAQLHHEWQVVKGDNCRRTCQQLWVVGWSYTLLLVRGTCTPTNTSTPHRPNKGNSARRRLTLTVFEPVRLALVAPTDCISCYTLNGELRQTLCFQDVTLRACLD